MADYRFELEKGGVKYACPACGKIRFVRYVDTGTGERVDDVVGRCDREDSCGYHLTPSEYFRNRFLLDNESNPVLCSVCGKISFIQYVDTATRKHVANVGICRSCRYSMTPSKYFQLNGFQLLSVAIPAKKRNPVSEQEPSLIDAALMQASLSQYNENNIYRWLCSVFGEEKAVDLTAAYQFGTSKHRFMCKDFPGYRSEPGSSVFWQIDKAGRIRAGKIMLYNSSTGHRVKEPFNHIQWVHKVMKVEPYHLRQCLFGEHLLSVDQDRPVAIVESEKTAIVAAGFMLEFLWLATAGKNNLNREKLKAVQGRRVVLFPDLMAFDRWREIVKGMPGVTVSDILERRATEADRAAGLDLADFLLRENGF